VNAPRGGGNRRDVLTSWRTTILALATGLSLGGCGAPPAQSPLAGAAPGTTTLRVVNHVSSPSELDRVSISIDGEPVALSSVPPPGDDPAMVATLRLPPGAHTIAVRAKARARGSEVVVVGAQQPFHVGAAAAAITIDVRSGAEAEGASTPVSMVLAIAGGRMDPEFGVAPSDDKDERCARLLPVPRAICRAAVDLDEATRRRDVVAALCVRDKLTEMRKLALITEAGAGESVAMAEAGVLSLSRQVDSCVGTLLASPAPDGLTVEPSRRR
jgi:hypothetical protein